MRQSRNTGETAAESILTREAAAKAPIVSCSCTKTTIIPQIITPYDVSSVDRYILATYRLPMLRTALQLDLVDRHILQALQLNARTSNADIARELDMAPSAILERIRKLEQRGIITGYEARLAPKALGLGLTAFVFARFTAAGGGEETDRALATIPEVSEIHHVAGEDCLLIKLRVRDTDDLSRVLGEIKQQPHLIQTRTTIVLTTAKESSTIALPAEAADTE